MEKLFKYYLLIEGKTGHFFHEQSPEALIQAVKEFEKIKAQQELDLLRNPKDCRQMKFDPKECRKNALKYDRGIFKRKIKKFVDEKYAQWKKS